MSESFAPSAPTDFRPVKLIAYRLRDGAAEPTPGRCKREWMERSSQKFAYRCLPLRVANTHGWELCSDVEFEARWDGGSDLGGVQIRMRGEGLTVPTSHFGEGVLTIQLDWLFRTEPANIGLWVSGPPNWPKDGISPLSGLIETAWAPFTFTMNWMFTRPGKWVRFDVGEPLCFIFPLDYVAIETAEVAVRDLAEEPELNQAFQVWSASRKDFNARLKQLDPEACQEKWQKDYFVGRHPMSKERPELHRFKMAPAPFTREAAKTESSQD